MAEITRDFVVAPKRRSQPLRLRYWIGRVLILATLTVGAIIFAAPFLWLVSSSLKEPAKIWLFPPQWIPNPVRWANYTEALNAAPFASLVQKPQLTMFGRTYSIGYEPDLKEVLIDRPRRTVLNPEWKWSVWYPLRRSGRFAQLPAEEQRVILAEHGAIGMSFGAADYAHDIRLACHGLDKDDNDFVIGLIGKDLYPLSAIVQTMRKTQQTSLYLERLGPFFVGRALWQSTE